MPLLMSTLLRPRRERRLPAVHPGPRPEPQGDRAALQARRRRVRPVQPRHRDGLPGHQAAARHGPAGHLQRRPRGADGAGRARLALPQARQAGAPQRGPAADRQRRRLPRRLLRLGAAQGLPRLVEHHRHQGRAALAGLGPRAALPLDRASTTASSGRGPSTRRATAGSPRSSRARPSRSAPRSSSSRRSTRVITKNGRATGVALADGTEYYADTVVSALDPRRTFLELVNPRELPDDLVENIQRFRFQGTSSKVNFALDGLPNFPAARPEAGPLPRLHEHRAVDGLPRARLRRREVRLVQPEPVHRHGHPVDDRRRTWRRPASTS